ncbi:roadblock/LC7 domain-containing protein [Micromonospora cathayae]|uniref:Roadblock/LC7 domain-containing protein n=1 Tax=Micromonospora cathayae TaxID=3028804 RepID=A0ABY7ZPC5_9ACTN|nr:roadblock/LC7 domain-containing protein [Micromonospora sp. HUAS 3]WDZ84750.1 roadblock/LC7 domain-containing protein [Micromonospora sp. HUAS 3]
MNAGTLMDAELRRLRSRRPEVSGTVLAGTDGLLIASDLAETAAAHLAALAAASFGLGQRVAQAVEQGEFREHVVRTTAGHVVIYPAGGHALLALVAGAGTDPETLHDDARAVAVRVGRVFDAHRTGYTEPLPPVVPGPLTTRTPMATIPGHLRRTVPAWRRPPI